VRRLLARELSDEGSLPVEAAFEAGPSGLGQGRLTVRLGGGPGGPEEGATPGEGPLRATVGIAREGREPLVFHEVWEPEAGLGGEAPDERLHELPVTLPEGAESRVAVLVEDLATGRWGAAFASYLDSTPLDELGAEAAALSDLLPSPRVVRLLAPREPFVIGRTELEAVASDPRVQRVDFFLDGERRGVSGAPPFRASLDFGALPRPRRVEAVAYGAGGEVLGRDLLVVNEGGGSFRVRIVAPGPEATGTAEAPLVGPVDVEAELTLPPGARLERVDFYWNTSLVASRFAAPFRQRVVVPAAAPDGFVRVVARLADGATAEDVVFVNSPGTAERLDVNLVEMYVVVTDREGRPVSGLGPEDFRVYEEGQEKELATFSDARSLPLTVGLVIDSSASMFVKLPSVGLAAGRFVRDSLEGDDRAFVVGFGGEPELVQETTSDDSRLIRSIATLRADGQTALWEAVVYSLVQIQGAPGKKALIVYTDGADEDEDFPYRTTLRFARQVGVPVYFVLTNNEIVRTGGKGLGVRGFLGRVRELAGEVGGNIYVVRHGEDLSAVYGEIGRELRSQYLLTYYSEDLPEATYRRVRVEAVDPALRVRTIAGYFK
jgi:Ca-activated chloride channel family protein